MKQSEEGGFDCSEDNQCMDSFNEKDDKQTKIETIIFNDDGIFLKEEGSKRSIHLNLIEDKLVVKDFFEELFKSYGKGSQNLVVDLICNILNDEKETISLQVDLKDNFCINLQREVVEEEEEDISELIKDIREIRLERTTQNIMILDIFSKGLSQQLLSKKIFSLKYDVNKMFFNAFKKEKINCLNARNLLLLLFGKDWPDYYSDLLIYNLQVKEVNFYLKYIERNKSVNK